MAVKGLARLGPVMQLAWLPEDFDAALEHWTKTMGVGPFFIMENIALADMRYMGQPTNAVFTLALSYWGDTQIELIRPENDAPSIYNGPYAVRDRMHHTCLLVDDPGRGQGRGQRRGDLCRSGSRAGLRRRNSAAATRHGRSVQHDEAGRRRLGRQRPDPETRLAVQSLAPR
jgi:hypothetical protein